MNECNKEVNDDPSSLQDYIVGIPAVLTNKISFGKTKMYEPLSKVKKHHLILENEGMIWRDQIQEWFRKLSIEDRVIA